MEKMNCVVALLVMVSMCEPSLQSASKDVRAGGRILNNAATKIIKEVVKTKMQDVKSMADFLKMFPPQKSVHVVHYIGNAAISTKAMLQTFCSGKKDGNYIDPTRCNGYIACSGGWSIQMPCPPTLIYHFITDRCVYGDTVTCARRRKPKPLAFSESKSLFVLGSAATPTDLNDDNSIADNALTRRVECEPIDSILDLSNTINTERWRIGRDGFAYNKCIKHKQCGGCCQIGQRCVPDSIAHKTARVLLVDYINLRQSYVKEVKYTEHTSCTCACRVAATDCVNKQTYDDDNCKCACKVKGEVCEEGKQWSAIECGCTCKVLFPKCTGGTQWSNGTCSCT